MQRSYLRATQHIFRPKMGGQGVYAVFIVSVVVLLSSAVLPHGFLPFVAIYEGHIWNSFSRIVHPFSPKKAVCEKFYKHLNIFSSSGYTLNAKFGKLQRSTKFFFQVQLKNKNYRRPVVKSEKIGSVQLLKLNKNNWIESKATSQVPAEASENISKLHLI